MPLSLRRPVLGFVADLQTRLTAAFVEVVREKDPPLADLLESKFAIQRRSDRLKWLGRGAAVRRRKQKHGRMKAYIELWNTLPPARQLALAGAEAKIGHLNRRARIIGTTAIVQAYNDMRPTTAGSINFVVAHCRDNRVSAAQMQQFLDENAVAWFSLTGHPTNPNTVAYYEAETTVCRVLANETATRDDLLVALRVLRDTAVVGPRKSPVDEAAETLNTLDVIYDTALAQKALFETALAEHGYAAEGVAVRQPLIRPAAWTLGDGDGNTAITGEAFDAGVALHRQRVGRRHLEILERAEAELKGKGADGIANLRAAFTGAENWTAERILKQAEALQEQTGSAALADLVYLLRCFGTGFSTIDIRHNAADLLTTAAWWAKRYDLPGAAIFATALPERQAAQLAGWLDTAETRDKFVGHLYASTDDHDAQTAIRIHGHLQAAARQPDMCDKLIIAETTHAAHALAAFFMLKITGHEIGTPETRIDVTILSESVADLIGLGRLLEDLLDVPAFRRQIACRRRLLAMIAKSDTTRLDGRGEAEYAQYEAAVDIYRVIDKMKRRYNELEGVLTSVMNGGGHALQRGGGRVTEIPALHGMAAAEAMACDIGPSTLTIQGNQQGILFTPGRTALGTLEALAAQNLYSKAGIQGEMPPSPLEQDINKHYARQDSWIFAKHAGRAFDHLMKDNASVDTLLERAPWLSMKSGNVSSRPGKRGEPVMEIGVTPRGATGDHPKALAGRAISGERLTAHAGVPVFSLLGLKEAMEAVRAEGMARLNPAKYGDPLHHLYKAYKIHRDGVRATVNAAALADFDIAWLMLIGDYAPPPTERAKLATTFDPEKTNDAPVTLAWLERYFLGVEKLCCEMVTGEVAEGDFRRGEALHLLWPELARQVDIKNRMAEFAWTIEALRNQAFLHAPDAPLDETQYRITQALYSATDLIDAPVGIVATRTRLEPVVQMGRLKTDRVMPQSYLEKGVRKRLLMPSSLT